MLPLPPGGNGPYNKGGNNNTAATGGHRNPPGPSGPGGTGGSGGPVLPPVDPNRRHPDEPRAEELDGWIYKGGPSESVTLNPLQYPYQNPNKDPPQNTYQNPVQNPPQNAYQNPVQNPVQNTGTGFHIAIQIMSSRDKYDRKRLSRLETKRKDESLLNEAMEANLKEIRSAVEEGLFDIPFGESSDSSPKK